MIPESQLQTWTNQGATVSAQNTHQAIRTVIENHNWNSDVTFKTYLQGSYINYTNIYGDSDVDIVVEFESTYLPDLQSLSADEAALYKSQSIDGKYQFEDYYRETLNLLTTKYPNAVRGGDKCIKINGGNGRIPADVVVCIKHRKFQAYRGMFNSSYVEGIAFKNQSSGNWIINFPKQHIANGASKNTRCNDNYKPTLRMFKNARNAAYNRNLIYNPAPSYFIECLLYNVPDAHFTANTWGEIYCNVVNFLSNTNLNAFICQNEQVGLFGLRSDQWSTTEATNQINGWINLWNNW